MDHGQDASGFFGGITAGHGMADLAYSILEGVAFRFFEGYNAQRAAGVPIKTIHAVGGGTRSDFRVALMATLFGTEVIIPENGDNSACPCAARLSHAATDPAKRDSIEIARRGLSRSGDR